MHVLFVCNGNVCRSPIAERLAQALAAELDIRDLTAESAGMRAVAGFPIEPLAGQVITGLGGDPSGFRARKLELGMVEHADLILAMTTTIRDQLAGMAHGIGGRTFALLEARRIAKVTGAVSIEDFNRARNDLSLVGNEDIANPMGQPEAAYCQIGDRIAEALIPLLLTLHPAEAKPQPPVGQAEASRRATMPVFRPPGTPNRIPPQAPTFLAAAAIDSWQP